MDPAVVPVTRAARARCTACELPRAACVCALVERVDNAVDVLVLQHPREAREAKNSARLLRLGLARCRVVVGDVFDPIDLESRLHAPGRCSVLLYPDGAAGPPSPRLDAAPTQLVVLDGTWRKSRRMLLENPSLRQLPRLSLRPAAQSRYRVLRKARLATQLSTLEATCAALAHLEGDEARYAPLLRAFDRFVEDRAGRAARAPAGPE